MSEMINISNKDKVKEVAIRELDVYNRICGSVSDEV